MIIHHHIVIDQGSIGKLTIGEHAQGGEQGDSLNHTLAAVHLSLLRLNVANLIFPSSDNIGNLIFKLSHVSGAQKECPCIVNAL